MKRLLACFLLLLLVPPVSAQDNPITWTITPGYNGTFKLGAWIPVTITIANAGNDLRGELEWRWDASGIRFAQTIDLPRGARKRVIIPVITDTFGGGATVRLLVGTRVVASERVRFNQMDPSSFVVGIVSQSSNAFGELSRFNSIGGGTTLVRPEPVDLPERWELLQSLDLLVVHDIDTTSLGDAQRAAIALWVADGGQLIVSGDRVSTAAGLAALLPATVVDSARQVRVGDFAAQVGWRPRSPGTALDLLALTPHPSAEVLARSPAGDPVIVRGQYGAGRIIQTAFDAAALSGLGDAVSFWEQLLPGHGTQPPWTQLHSIGQWVLREALDLPALQLPSLWRLIGFLGLYILLAGPANYLLLRRLDRREWAYLTIPLLVAMFTAAAYVFGATGRGGTASVTALTIVRAAPGSTTGQMLSYVGIFSPTRRSYDVALGPDAFVSNAFSGRGPGDTFRVRQTEAAVELPSFLIDVGELRAVSAEQPAPAPDVRATFAGQGTDPITIQVENRGDRPLQDVAVLAGDTVQKVDDLAPGEQRTVVVEQTGFGGSVPFQSGGPIKRGAALEALRGRVFRNGMAMPPEPARDPFDAAAADPPAVTLIAWASGPRIDVRLDGRPVEVQGDTLYMWPVGAAR